MNDIFLPLEFSDEQYKAYVAYVEDTLERRRRNGVLLSSFDLIAGASAIFFATGNNSRMPAHWVFAMVKDDWLPMGLLEEAQQAKQALDDLKLIIDSLDTTLEIVYEMEKELKTYHNKIKDELKLVSAKLEEVNALKAKAIVIPTESEEAWSTHFTMPRMAK